MDVIPTEVIFCRPVKEFSVTVTHMKPEYSRALFPEKLLLQTFTVIFLFEFEFQSG